MKLINPKVFYSKDFLNVIPFVTEFSVDEINQIIHAFATYLDRAETEGATLKDATDPSSVRNAIRTNFVMVIDFF